MRRAEPPVYSVSFTGPDGAAVHPLDETPLARRVRAAVAALWGAALGARALTEQADTDQRRSA